MESATGEEYAAAEPDPVQPRAGGAIAHLNADHAASLVAMARMLGGYPDTTAAICTGVDRYGLDLGSPPTAGSPTPGSVMRHPSSLSTNYVRPPLNWPAGRGRDNLLLTRS